MRQTLHVLGHARLHYGDRASFLERKTAGLLAYLALEGRTSRSRLAGLLWPESIEATARNNLSQTLRRLKNLCQGESLIEGDSLLALTHPLEADAARFELARFGGARQMGGQVGREVGYAVLLEGLDYSDCPDFEEWLERRREGLARQHRQTLLEGLRAFEREGDFQSALGLAEELLEQDAFSEEAYRALMRLHLGLGNRSSALLSYGRCVKTLEGELGLEPSPQTQALARLLESEDPQDLNTVSTPVLSQRLEPPRIGRTAEWAWLERMWAAGRSGLIRGLPGQGKTRLLRDFLVQHAPDESVLWVQGHPTDVGVPLGGLARCLRPMLERVSKQLEHGVLEDWVRLELSRVLPELRQPNDPMDSDVSSPDADGSKLRFTQAQLEALRMAGASGLRTLVLDDFQYFDPATQHALLRWQSIGALQTFVLHRSGELSTDIDHLLERAVGAGHLDALELPPLELAEIQALLDALELDWDTLLPGQSTSLLAPELYRRTGGNPFFLLETVRLLLEQRGTLLGRAASLQVSTLLKARLERLTPEALRLAQVAAVLGPEFTLERAACVLGQSALSLLDPAQTLERDQILSGPRFAHDLLLEAVLAGLPSLGRRYLHAQVANLLEGELGRRIDAARLAHHWLEAAEPGRAASHLLEAAVQAQRTFDLQDAFERYCAAGCAYRDHTLEPEQATYAFEQALWLCDSDPAERLAVLLPELERLPPSPFARALCVFAEAVKVGETGDYTQCAALARKAYRLLEGANDLKEDRWTTLETRVRETLGASLLYGGEHVQALEVYREAYQFCVAHAPALAQANAASSLAVGLDLLGRYREASGYYREALERLEGLGDRPRQVLVLNDFSFNLRESGRSREALALLTRALELLERVQGIPDDARRTHGHLAECHLQRQEWKPALEHIKTALDLSHVHGLPDGFLWATRARIFGALGAFGEAHAALERALSQLTRASTRGAALLTQARLLHLQGLPALNALEEARAQLDPAPGSLAALRVALLEAQIAPTSPLQAALERELARSSDPDRAAYPVALHTRLAQLCLRYRQFKKALEHSREAVRLLEFQDPLDLPWAEVWLTHHRALHANQNPGADAQLEVLRSWLEECFHTQVPLEYQSGFRLAHLVHTTILQP